jgi:hypothetical protein
VQTACCSPHGAQRTDPVAAGVPQATQKAGGGATRGAGKPPEAPGGGDVAAGGVAGMTAGIPSGMKKPAEARGGVVETGVKPGGAQDGVETGVGEATHGGDGGGSAAHDPACWACAWGGPGVETQDAAGGGGDDCAAVSFSGSGAGGVETQDAAGGGGDGPGAAAQDAAGGGGDGPGAAAGDEAGVAWLGPAAPHCQQKRVSKASPVPHPPHAISAAPPQNRQNRASTDSAALHAEHVTPVIGPPPCRGRDSAAPRPDPRGGRASFHEAAASAARGAEESSGKDKNERGPSSGDSPCPSPVCSTR